jgi:hypothetical protein
VADPKSCRANALRCAELANDAKDDRLQNALYEMASSWLKVAAELEPAIPRLSGCQRSKAASVSVTEENVISLASTPRCATVLRCRQSGLPVPIH